MPHQKKTRPLLAIVAAAIVGCQSSGARNEKPVEEPRSAHSILRFEAHVDSSERRVEFVLFETTSTLGLTPIDVVRNGPTNTAELISTTSSACEPGLICVDVQVVSRFIGPLNNAFIALHSIRPALGNLVTNADVLPAAIDGGFGGWSYDAISEPKTKTWKFENSGTDFVIEGDLYASVTNVVVEPSEAPVGGIVTVSGTGFVDFAPGEIMFRNAAPIAMSTQQGSFSWTGPVPEGAESGDLTSHNGNGFLSATASTSFAVKETCTPVFPPAPPLVPGNLPAVIPLPELRGWSTRGQPVMNLSDWQGYTIKGATFYMTENFLGAGTCRDECVNAVCGKMHQEVTLVVDLELCSNGLLEKRKIAFNFGWSGTIWGQPATLPSYSSIAKTVAIAPDSVVNTYKALNDEQIRIRSQIDANELQFVGTAQLDLRDLLDDMPKYVNCRTLAKWLWNVGVGARGSTVYVASMKLSFSFGLGIAPPTSIAPITGTWAHSNQQGGVVKCFLSGIGCDLWSTQNETIEFQAPLPPPGFIFKNWMSGATAAGCPCGQEFACEIHPPLLQSADYSCVASYQAENAPNISSVAPASGVAGTTITVTGSRFLGATSLKVGGVQVPFMIVNDTRITFSSPPRSGFIVVTAPGGQGSSPAPYSNTGPAPINFSPQSGGWGTEITITPTSGSLAGATLVTIAGFAAGNMVIENGGTSIKATVSGATPFAAAGPVTVTLPTGVVMSATDFVQDQSPTPGG